MHAEAVDGAPVEWAPEPRGRGMLGASSLEAGLEAAEPRSAEPRLGRRARLSERSVDDEMDLWYCCRGCR